MPKDRDKKPNTPPAEEEEQYTLESILAEFGSPAPPPDESPAGPAYTPEDVAQDQQERREEAFFFPKKPKKPPEPPREGKLAAFPGMTLVPEGEDDEPTRPIPVVRDDPPPPPPILEDRESEEDEPTKVLQFPSPPPQNPVDKLRQKANDFADHMFENEGIEQSEAVRRAERLIPGTDQEEPPPPPKERKRRKSVPPPPDLSPAELHKLYGRGFKSFRARSWLLLLPLAALLYLTWDTGLSLLPTAALFLPAPVLRCYLMAAIQILALLLGCDTLWHGLKSLVRGGLGMDTLGSLAFLAVLTDTLTLPVLQPTGSMDRSPFSAVAVLTLWCLMRGELNKRRGQRTAARTAAAASSPYLVTQDEGKWNNRDTYIKWLGPLSGFGSQLQSPDGAQRIYQVISPVILVACLLFSLLSSVGRDRSQDFFWCLACTLSAATPLSATLCYGLPWRQLASRLSKSGAALAGWPGAVNTTGSSNLLLTDIDLFPAGSVAFNGIKVFGDVSLERMISLTATVIRDAGCGLDNLFHDLLRREGGIYRKGELLTAYEGGGLSEVFGHDLVQVGSASFMILMDVALPQGLKIKNAVFCAINGELAGIFALNYQLPNTVLPALDILIQNRITPVLATRDFNLIPSILRSNFKIPAEKMEFPPVERRRELSDPDQSHSSTLTALLCREGVYPYAEAVVGARRLRSSVRKGAVLASVGSVIGALLAFYLTFVGAYASLTPFNLLVFLVAWLVPAPLIAWWVDKY